MIMFKNRGVLGCCQSRGKQKTKTKTKTKETKQVSHYAFLNQRRHVN